MDEAASWAKFHIVEVYRAVIHFVYDQFGPFVLFCIALLNGRDWSQVAGEYDCLLLHELHALLPGLVRLIEHLNVILNERDVWDLLLVAEPRPVQLEDVLDQDAF